MSQREIKMPDLSTTGSQVTLSRWLVEVGQNVERGQFIAEVETDKALMEIESIATGCIDKLCVAAGQTVDVGQLIAVISTADGKA